jgi:hypothetical protein
MVHQATGHPYGAYQYSRLVGSRRAWVRDKYRLRDKCDFPILTEDILDPARAGLYNSGLVPATEVDDWMEQVETGIDAPLKVLLLSLAPNIVLSLGRRMMNHLTSQILHLFLDIAIQRVALMPAQIRSRVFPALKEVRLIHQSTHDYWGGCLNVTSYDITYFFLIPALENLLIRTHMTCIRGSIPNGDYNKIDWSFSPRESSISRLCMRAF